MQDGRGNASFGVAGRISVAAWLPIRGLTMVIIPYYSQLNIYAKHALRHRLCWRYFFRFDPVIRRFAVVSFAYSCRAMYVDVRFTR